MIMKTKLIAGSRRLTWGVRQHLHAGRSGRGVSSYVARPIDDLLRKHAPGFELLDESLYSAVCFSPANIPDGLTQHLKRFKPRDGYHTTGLQFITDNLDLVVLKHTLGHRPGGRAGEELRLIEQCLRTAYVYLPDTIIKLNSATRIELVFTPRLFRPAAEHFLTRLVETRVVPGFNRKYQEIRSRFAELLWIDYAQFLRNSVKYVSTTTDQWIYQTLDHEITAARQKITECNARLGLAKLNFELFPFKPDFSFNVRRFFAQSDWPRSVEPARP
jgi:hypothetical protein